MATAYRNYSVRLSPEIGDEILAIAERDDVTTVNVIRKFIGWGLKADRRAQERAARAATPTAPETLDGV